MNTLKTDLDLNLPVGIPDLPPPWPPTDVAIDWWMNRAALSGNLVASEERLASPRREHFDEPFILRE